MRGWTRVLGVSTLALAIQTGCVHHVFHTPVSISTRSEVAHHANTLGPVTAESTSYFFVLLPWITDPRQIYDDLLAEARQAGGNAVLDVQVRSRQTFIWAFPIIVADTIEATGTAAVVE